MNYQAKITPTGTDLLKERGPKIITPAHEPLSTGEPWKPAGDYIPWQGEPPKETQPTAEVKPLQVALIGTAPSSRMLAPFNDPNWEIWACSPGNMNVLPRVDIWFELHANLLWPECVSYGGPYIEWLKQQKFPIYMQDQSFVPNAITFPKEEMVKKFGPYFFTSSFAWMMAFAISKGAKKIALYGIDMASKDEYILQRAGGQYFMQLAASLGIEVIAPKESDLMQPPQLYGYSEITPFGRKIHVRTQEIKERLANMRVERDKLAHNITYLEGALEDLDYVQSIWGSAQER